MAVGVFYSAGRGFIGSDLIGDVHFRDRSGKKIRVWLYCIYYTYAVYWTWNDSFFLPPSVLCWKPCSMETWLHATIICIRKSLLFDWISKHQKCWRRHFRCGSRYSIRLFLV
jgi:hypothetical protein